MCCRHRADASLDCCGEIADRSALMPGAGNDGTDGCKCVFHAMVELGNQYALAFLCALALGDIACQALDAHDFPCGVKLALCRLLQPYLSAVRADVAEI